MGDIYGSNNFFAHFENSNFGQFAIFLANLRYFWPWRSSEGPKGPDLVPTATGWSNWVNHIHIMCSGPLWDLYGTPGAPKRAHFGPERPFWWPRRSSVGPGGPDLVPTAADWSDRDVIIVTTHFGLVLGLFCAPKRARFGPKCPFWRPRRSSEGPRGPDLVPTAANWSAWVRLIVTTHLGLMLGLIVAAKGLNLAEKGHFGPKGALLEPPGARKRPDTRPKCVVAMSPTQVDQTAAVGTKPEPPGPTEDLRGHQKGLSGPK